MDMTKPEAEKRNEPTADSTALELLRQLITLASGVLVLSSTFVDKLWSPNVMLQALLAATWIILAGSIVAGLQAMSAMVQGALRPEFPWAKDAIRNWAAGSKWAFIIGIALFAVYAFLAAESIDRPSRDNARTCINVARCGS